MGVFSTKNVYGKTNGEGREKNTQNWKLGKTKKKKKKIVCRLQQIEMQRESEKNHQEGSLENHIHRFSGGKCAKIVHCNWAFISQICGKTMHETRVKSIEFCVQFN